MARRYVLILEDDPHLIRLYEKVLVSEGYNVHSATSIDVARRWLSEKYFDVFLCDVEIGSETTLTLLTQHVGALRDAGTQVVVVSGMDHYEGPVRELGVSLFMTKPVSPESLKRLLHALSDYGHLDTGEFRMITG